MEALTILTSISAVLLIGIIFSIIATKLKIPEILVLIVAGIILGFIQYHGEQLIQFPNMFLTSVSLLALALIVFDSASKLRLKELDVLSLKALKFVGIFTLLSLVIFTIAAKLFLGIPLVLALLFVTINLGTSPDVVLSLLKETKHKIMGFLKLESVFNTPLNVLLPFIIIDFVQGQSEISNAVSLIVPFLTKFVVGIGAGIFVGVILFKIMQKRYSPLYSPLAVIIASLLAYVLAENLRGNGVLAVITLGIFFGNVYVKEKVALLSVESVLTKAFFIFVFILLGLTIKLPFTAEFFIRSLVLFAAYLLIRFLAVVISFRKEKLKPRELAFITLNAPKGISTAAVVFLLAIYDVPGTIYYIPGISIVLDVTLAFILYSILLSTVVCSLKDKFIVPRTVKK
ncbi:cation:proton antiporter [Candidatus Woesearchaeota archaeon]|nr:cation:proton antiporter [Candidatus Woesearchaeota archaeon]